MYSFRVCLRCGEVLFPLTTAKVDECDDCGFNMIEIQYTGRYDNNINDQRAVTEDFEEQLEDIIENTVKKSPNFDQVLFDKRVQEEEDFHENVRKSIKQSCPYCGSTNFQLVRRKWSMLTGFFTTKMDKYCVNCGKKVN